MEITTRAQVEKVLDDFDCFLFDCDGVMWLDDKLVPGVEKVIELLHQRGKKYAFVLNNSSALRKAYVKKFQNLGIPAVSEGQMFPTCYGAASYLKNHLKLPLGTKVWVLGESGIEEELQLAGFKTLGCNDPRLDDEWDPNHPLLVPDPEVKAVMVGLTKKFNFMRIATTLQYLLKPEVAFIGANVDRTYPGPRGMVLPAGGAVVHEMMYTSGRECVNVGKPCSTLLLVILDEHPHFNGKRTLMVGDTLYTDIKFGNDGHLGATMLVMTGGTSRKLLDDALKGTDDSMKPTYVIESLADLMP